MVCVRTTMEDAVVSIFDSNGSIVVVPMFQYSREYVRIYEEVLEVDDNPDSKTIIDIVSDHFLGYPNAS